LKRSQEHLHRFQLRLDQDLLTPRHFDAEPEEFQDDLEEGLGPPHVLDRRQPLHHHFETAALGEHVRHLVHLLVVDGALGLVVQGLDEFFGGVAQEAAHPVHHSHGVVVAAFGHPNLQRTRRDRETFTVVTLTFLKTSFTGRSRLMILLLTNNSIPLSSSNKATSSQS
jgi:hypothetical protein